MTWTFWVAGSELLFCIPWVLRTCCVEKCGRKESEEDEDEEEEDETESEMDDEVDVGNSVVRPAITTRSLSGPWAIWDPAISLHLLVQFLRCASYASPFWELPAGVALRFYQLEASHHPDVPVLLGLCGGAPELEFEGGLWNVCFDPQVYKDGHRWVWSFAAQGGRYNAESPKE